MIPRINQSSCTHNASFEEAVLQPIMEAIDRYGEKNAFFIDERFFTYKEFAGYIAVIRESLKVVPSEADKVGLVINNDIQTYASIFALWLEGKSYVPLHPYWPLDRCLDIVDQVGIKHVLDSSKQSRYVGIKVIDTDVLVPQGVPGTICHCPNDALAYILFTSGSTGKPKGVQISRGNVSAFISSFWKTGINLGSDDRCLQCFDLSFDVSVQSYLAAIIRGACVYTVSYGQMKFLSVAQLLEEHKISFGAMPPSMLRYLQPYFAELDFSSFGQCILTAEACPADLVYDWLRYASTTRVWNFYGPTECTIYCTFYKVDGQSDVTYNGIMSIGKPMEGVCAYIVDEQGRILGDREKGELCIAGPQVTMGYWNDETKNKSSFSMLDTGTGLVRIYHTGDFCYRNENGDILYSGRIDNQAKIQGFRVELSEIEYHAHAFLKNVNVVCVVYKNDKSLDEIAMCFESEEFDTDALVEYMRGRVPQYMMPTRYVFIPQFPINANGKVDRKTIKDNINQ